MSRGELRVVGGLIGAVIGAVIGYTLRNHFILAVIVMIPVSVCIGLVVGQWFMTRERGIHDDQEGRR